MGDLKYTENAVMQNMCDHANGNGRAPMYHVQFPGRRMPNHRIFQRLHRHFRKTRSTSPDMILVEEDLYAV
ncbi:hypothetical protein TNCV_3527191 [Trichonephila clavipes]|nr:hypothetical protein TNCV_3527191 [Trichonephila clavipes]